MNVVDRQGPKIVHEFQGLDPGVSLRALERGIGGKQITAAVALGLHEIEHQVAQFVLNLQGVGDPAGVFLDLGEVQVKHGSDGEEDGHGHGKAERDFLADGKVHKEEIRALPVYKGFFRAQGLGIFPVAHGADPRSRGRGSRSMRSGSERRCGWAGGTTASASTPINSRRFRDLPTSRPIVTRDGQRLGDRQEGGRPDGRQVRLESAGGSNHPSAGRELHGVSSNSFWNAWNVDFADATASP